jgi:transposase InsO family protein
MPCFAGRGATRWVFVRIMPAKTAANARRFLRDLHRACPIRIAKILTPSRRLQANDERAMDNGKEFTDRLFASRARAASGEHEFDLLCTELGTSLGIEHRLTPPKSPQTNGIPLVHFPMHCRAAGLALQRPHE